MIVADDSSKFENTITIKYEKAIMTGSIIVKNHFFHSLQYQLSNKVERPARLELIIDKKLNINRNGILFLENELITKIINYKFYIPLLWMFKLIIKFLIIYKSFTNVHFSL